MAAHLSGLCLFLAELPCLNAKSRSVSDMRLDLGMPPVRYSMTLALASHPEVDGWDVDVIAEDRRPCEGHGFLH